MMMCATCRCSARSSPAVHYGLTWFEKDNSNWIDSLWNKFCKILTIMIRWRRWWRQSRQTSGNSWGISWISRFRFQIDRNAFSKSCVALQGRGENIYISMKIGTANMNATYRHTQLDLKSPARTSSVSGKKSINYFQCSTYLRSIISSDQRCCCWPS